MKSPASLPREMSDDEIWDKHHQEDEGPYKIPADIVPIGYVYEWKMFTTFGKEKDNYHADLLRQGWREVPMGRHRERWGVKGMPDDAPTMLNGMVLMEQPEHLYRERKRYYELVAKRQVRDKEQQIGQRMPGSVLPRRVTRMAKGYDRIEVE